METGRRHPLEVLAWPLLVVWVGASLSALWWFGRVHLQPFAFDTRQYRHLADGPRIPARISAALGLEAAAGQVTLLHLGDARCRCESNARRHLDRLRQRFAGSGLRVVEIGPDQAGALADWLPVQSAPAALVLDRDGRLSYFGPYGSGTSCLQDDAEQVERALAGALEHRSGTTRLDLLGIGCYCPWPAADTASVSKQGMERTST